MFDYESRLIVRIKPLGIMGFFLTLQAELLREFLHKNPGQFAEFRQDRGPDGGFPS
jgi:hypothetical protein